MAEIVVTTSIAAPLERCFDLSLNVDLHVASAQSTRERAIGGVTTGMMVLGDTVTWQARHLGVWFRLTSQITQYDRPRYFQDRMISGPFAEFEHDHWFEGDGVTTQMRDRLSFRSPMGVLGRVVDRLVLVHHMTRFLGRRNAHLRAIAESDELASRYISV